jgi:GAF domain-containing protein
VYLGARILDQQWGVCPNTIQVFTALDDSLNISTDVVTANKTCYVMNDLSAIPVYANRPYVAGWPHMRFYAEVPILSPTGFVIGTYCVVDNKPRNGLDDKCFAALNEIASAIMNHLALVRSQYTLQRSAEMVKGLGLFVEGKMGFPRVSQVST